MREHQNLKLVGETVVLVPYRKKYVEKYFKWLQDPWIREMTASEECTLDEEYAAQEAWSSDPKKLTFIVLDASVESASLESADAAVGDVNLILDACDSKVAEILVMIAEPTCRRRGFAVAAVSLMMFFARTRLGIQRFFCKISTKNDASLRLFEHRLQFSRCGFSEVFQEVELECVFDRGASIARPTELLSVIPSHDASDDRAGEDLSSLPIAKKDGASEVTESPFPTPLVAKLNKSEPLIKIQSFSGLVGDGLTEVAFSGQVMLLNGSCVVSLAGGADTPQVEPSMGPLCVGMSSRFDPMPLTSTLLGENDELPRSLCQHLARRTSMQCFVSSSLPEAATNFLPEILKHIQDALRVLQES
jgi:RimJ/RimL family protein N-acetyltransferase